MFAGIQNLCGNFFVSRIRSADEDGVTPIEEFLERSSGMTAKSGSHRLREGRVYVIKAPKCHAGILCQVSRHVCFQRPPLQRFQSYVALPTSSFLAPNRSAKNR